MTKNALKIIVSLLILILLAGGAYWYFFMRVQVPSMTSATEGNANPSTGFNPFGRTPTPTPAQTPTGNTATTTIISTSNPAAPIPVLRLLSDSPIGGYSASTTGTTTVVRWIDRGRGNVYEAREDDLNVQTVSNTLLPRVYSSVWNKNMTSFVAMLLPEGSSNPTTVLANLVLQSVPKSSTSTLPASLTPYALRGENLPGGIIGYAVDPKQDKVFLLIAENGGSSGYIMTFDGRSMTKLFSSPLAQLNVDWPSDNVIAITTKGGADSPGYLYLVDAKTGVWKKAVGPLPGLSAKVSRDAKYAIVSAAGNSDNMITAIYNLQKGTNADAVIRTLADKCVWGNFYKNLVYCGVPFQQVPGTYPDDWYTGHISFTDKIWQVNADTGELHQISPLFDQSDRVIDTFDLGLDPKDNYLFFMNKNDLSFWSLDLDGATGQ